MRRMLLGSRAADEPLFETLRISSLIMPVRVSRVSLAESFECFPNSAGEICLRVRHIFQVFTQSIDGIRSRTDTVTQRNLRFVRSSSSSRRPGSVAFTACPGVFSTSPRAPSTAFTASLRSWRASQALLGVIHRLWQGPHPIFATAVAIRCSIEYV